MRVISGKYRGKILQSPEGNKIRPTADKVKEAVFSAIDSRIGINGCKILDAFCGSGAIGIEAMSRGADSIYMMDINTKLARDNTQGFPEENMHIMTCDVTNPPKSSQIMDIIYIDPPYSEQLGDKAIKALIDAGWGNKDTLFIVETDSKDETIDENAYSSCKMKKYGKTKVFFIIY